MSQQYDTKMSANTIAHRQWTPFEIFEEKDEPNIALFILNRPIPSMELLARLWKNATLKVAVDGGANRLMEVCAYNKCYMDYIPDIVSGDLDSAASKLLKFYKKHGAQIIETPDQNAVDFTKALRVATTRLQEMNKEVSAFVAFVSMGGRIDHMFGNFNALFLAQSFCAAPIYIVDFETITWLLQPGKHHITILPELLQSNCGLIPLDGACLHVTTTGFKWNLEDAELQFSAVVSTSNTFLSEFVTVDTDNSILFTMERVIPKAPE